MHQIKFGREWLKDSLRKQTDFSSTDQNKGVPAPPVQKGYDVDSPRVVLASAQNWRDVIQDRGLDQLIRDRKSRRRFTDKPLSLEALSFLLWATQGLRKGTGASPSFRTVPSAGARHSFETYLFVFNVQAVAPGLYRYLPLEHELLFLKQIPEMRRLVAEAAFGQGFVGNSAVTFAWACIPYRMEWRYAQTAYRVILMDAGHVCQNLYLGCEAVGAGACAVAAYDQEAMDELIGLDGHDEFVIYLAPVGKV